MSRHDLDLTSLISGLIFATVGALFLLDLTVDYDVSARWVIPIVLIGLGAAGLLSTVKESFRRTPEAVDEDPSPPTESASDH